MRSDYFGDPQFDGLPETINQGLYLVPRITPRRSCAEAITGPVAVGGGTIAPRLVQRLLNDAGADPDQLPVLQHALMRIWDLWTGDVTGSWANRPRALRGCGGTRRSTRPARRRGI